MRKKCSFLEGHGSLACDFKYLIAIVNGRFTQVIVMVKRPYTIGVKYLSSQAQLPCSSRKLHLFRTRSVCIYYITVQAYYTYCFACETAVHRNNFYRCLFVRCVCLSGSHIFLTSSSRFSIAMFCSYHMNSFECCHSLR